MNSCRNGGERKLKSQGRKKEGSPFYRAPVFCPFSPLSSTTGSTGGRPVLPVRRSSNGTNEERRPESTGRKYRWPVNGTTGR